MLRFRSRFFICNKTAIDDHCIILIELLYITGLFQTAFSGQISRITFCSKLIVEHKDLIAKGRQQVKPRV